MKQLFIKINSITDQKKYEYSFHQEKIYIGRNEDNDIVLTHKLISSKHAMIEWKDDAYHLFDTGSQLGILDHKQNQISQLKITENLEAIIGVYEFHFSFTEHSNTSTSQIQPTQKPSKHESNEAPASIAPASKRNKKPNKTLFQTLFQSASSPSDIKTPSEHQQNLLSKSNISFKWKPPLDIYRQKTGMLVVITALLFSTFSYLFLYQDKQLTTSVLIKHNSEKYAQALTKHGMEMNCDNCHTKQIPNIKSESCIQCHQDALNIPFHQTHQALAQNELKALKTQAEEQGVSTNQVTLLKQIEMDQAQQIRLSCVSCHSEHKKDNTPSLEQNGGLVLSAKCIGCHPDRSNLLENRTISFFKNRHQPLSKEAKLPTSLNLPKVTTGIGINISNDLHQLHQLHENISGQCAGCHANENRDGPEKNIISQCFRCHTPYQGVFKGNFDANTELNKADCVDCHHYSNDLIAHLKGLEGPKNKNKQNQSKNNAKQDKLAQKKLTLSADDLKILAKKSTSNPSQEPSDHLVTLSISSLILILLFFIANVDRPKMILVDEDKQELPSKKLIHILEDPCVGCGECVSACPFDVLALYKSEQGKKIAKVVNFDSCNECDACVKACKPEALTRRKANEPLPMISRPDLDSNYMTSLEGVYLIGEASGKSLIRNANNLGSKVIQHMLYKGVSPNIAQSFNLDYDVIIVGAGPAGLSAGISAMQANLKHIVIEKSNQYLNILREAYPAGKEIQNQPVNTKNIGPLPMDQWEIMSKEEFLKSCDQLMSKNPIHIKYGESVIKLKALENGAGFKIETTQGTYTSYRVILALGTRGNPRKLNCKGTDLEHVKYHLADPKVHQNQDIIVVGGGNSALEAAVALARIHQGTNRVSLVYRGSQFNKTSSEKNISELEALEKAGKIKVYRDTNPSEIKEKSIVLKVGASHPSELELPCDMIYCMLGAEAPNQWLQQQGIKYIDKPQGWSPSASDDISFF